MRELLRHARRVRRPAAATGLSTPLATDGPAATRQRLARLIAGYRSSLALSTVAKLRLADVLAAGPKSVEAIAPAVGADPNALFRLLRLVAAMDLFVEVG